MAKQKKQNYGQEFLGAIYKTRGMITDKGILKTQMGRTLMSANVSKMNCCPMRRILHGVASAALLSSPGPPAHLSEPWGMQVLHCRWHGGLTILQIRIYQCSHSTRCVYTEQRQRNSCTNARKWPPGEPTRVYQYTPWRLATPLPFGRRQSQRSQRRRVAAVRANSETTSSIRSHSSKSRSGPSTG